MKKWGSSSILTQPYKSHWLGKSDPIFLDSTAADSLVMLSPAEMTEVLLLNIPHHCVLLTQGMSSVLLEMNL